MKIRYEIPGFMQREEMTRYIASKPDMTREDVITEWLELRYRTWIVDNIVSAISDVKFEPSTSEPVSIDLTFSKTKDGQKFLKTMGGRVI